MVRVWASFCGCGPDSYRCRRPAGGLPLGRRKLGMSRYGCAYHNRFNSSNSCAWPTCARTCIRCNSSARGRLRLVEFSNQLLGLNQGAPQGSFTIRPRAWLLQRVANPADV